MGKRVTITDHDTVKITNRSGHYEVIPSKHGLIIRHWRPTEDHYTTVVTREGPKHAGWGEVRIEAREWD